MSTVAHPREAFPIAPEAGRTVRTAADPSGPEDRPWILRFARVPDAQQATIAPQAVYDEEMQVSLTPEGDLIAVMANTHSPTIPDGSVPNPPPLDEGTKD